MQILFQCQYLFIMSKQQHSASLEIVENSLEHIQITPNSFQLELPQQSNSFRQQKIGDTFELSLDENSLSFQIEQLKLQSTHDKPLKVIQINSQIKVQTIKPPVIDNVEKKPLPFVQEQRKRKRKEIFQKYKQKTTQNILASPELQSKSNDIMNTFDEIFMIKSPQKPQRKQQASSNVQQNIIEHFPSISTTRFKKKQSIFGAVGASILNNFPDTSSNKNLPEPPLIKKVQAKTSMAQFQIPSNFSQPQTIDPDSNLVIECTNSFIMETDQNKISMIYAQEQEVSRDSGDLETFLKSQIFKDEILDSTLRKNDISYKNIQISALNPSMMLDQENCLVQNKNIQNRFEFPKENSEKNIFIQQNKALLKKLPETNNIFEAIQIQPVNVINQEVLCYEQNRIPIYLREIRKKNTTYPNFNTSSKNINFYREQNTDFKELLQEFKKGLNFLSLMNQLTNERHCILTSLQKVLLNSLTVQTFLTCGWQRTQNIKEINLLKPHQNFIKRKYDYQKVKGVLSNYLYIVQYYQNCSLNLEEERVQRKYLEIRAKFWQIEKNMKMIGEDIYLLAIQEIFPSHYYEFLHALKGSFPMLHKQNQLLQYCRNLLAKYFALKQQGDIICHSEIGKALRRKLQKMIHKTFLV